MTKRIFKYISLVALAVFLACLVLIMGVLYEYFTSVLKTQLAAQTNLAAQGVAAVGEEFLKGLEDEDYRITWIAADGTVLYDSKADAAEMENHAGREEISEAMESGRGQSSRFSSTLMERQLYAAQSLPDGSVIRLSSTQYTVMTLLLSMLQPFLVIFVIAVVLSLVFADQLSKRIVRPLNNLNLDDPLSNEGYDELSPLLRRIDSQHRQIVSQLNELSRRQEEFDTITASMSEGLVLMRAEGDILSINGSAERILGAAHGCVGQSMLTVNRSLPMQELLESAASGERAERVIELSGGEYQLDASPVLSDGKVGGIVLLLFDISDKAGAERMRREFTANVSHELKTPLHSISGCAELLLNGMVKPEDIKQFTGQIYSEAQRMIRLVDDIIKLSSLDEGASGAFDTPCDLYSSADEVLKSLEAAAGTAGVSLELKGESAVISASPQLLQGIIFNLCVNAIKYNREGGSVFVSVCTEGTDAVLKVSDTGIGIPPEHQARVFERFYRVDKSHSKEIGGTGLGLSIVKHSARLLGAQIQLESTPGEGSVFMVRFPKKA